MTLITQICRLAVALTLASIPPPVFAQGGMGKEPGTRLLARCESVERMADSDSRDAERLNSEAQADAQACMGFLEGFIWGHAWASWRESKDMWFCLPEGFTGAQGVPVVVDYLRGHPDRLDEDAHLLVFLALTARYPCK